MVTYAHHDGESAAPLSNEIVNLYATVYSEPPYEEGPDQVERFRDSLPDEMKRQGFSLVAAHADDQLVGVSYGWTMPAGVWWSRADQQPSDEVLDSAKLAVMEWIVEPRRRGKGIGAELIQRLLGTRAERYATLASDPRSTARKMYERVGWWQVARTKLTWGPEMDLLVLDLGDSQVQALPPSGSGEHG